MGELISFIFPDNFLQRPRSTSLAITTPVGILDPLFWCIASKTIIRKKMKEIKEEKQIKYQIQALLRTNRYVVLLHDFWQNLIFVKDNT